MTLGTITKPGGYSDYTEANKRVRVRDIQLTSGANYTTGGETVNASSIGMNAIFEAIPLGLALPSGAATSRSVGVVYASDNRSVKLAVHTTASAEAAGNSDQSTFTVRVRFIGR